jgi:DNA-dependent RNA polymerase auxiliary subunit epsilon
MIRLKYSLLGNIKVEIRYIDNNNVKIQFIEFIKDNIMKFKDNEEAFEVDMMN